MNGATESASSEMATPSTFSYAQAAKGQGVPPSVGPSSNNTAVAQASQEAPSANKTMMPAETATESSDPACNADPPAPVTERHNVGSNEGSECESRSENAADKSSESKPDDDAGRLDRPWRRARPARGTRSSSATTRSFDESDLRKSGKSKQAKTAEKQAGERAPSLEKDQPSTPDVPKVELSEAPIPAVNCWQQRREALAARARPPVSGTERINNGVPGHADDANKASKTEADFPSATRDTPPTNGPRPAQRAVDASRPERNGSRGSRVIDTESKTDKVEAPPSVHDIASWPTPETANQEDRRKSSSVTDRQEPVKESQDDGAQGKPRQKSNWVAYQYVPSVAFETQIPPLRSSKPRGGARGPNGTRTSTGSAPADKAASTTPTTKSSEFKERSRETVGFSNRNASLPPVSKRASMDASGPKDTKKGGGHDRNAESTSNQPTEFGHGFRERPEGRSERGRGGYRGRGGHNSMNSHSQHAHGASNYANGPLPFRASGPYSPPPRQGGHQVYMPPQQRGGRGRNGAGSNYNRMSLPNGSTRLPPVQTQFGPYEYPMAPMTAVPYQHQPFWDGYLISMLRPQIEYYFSIENLCKDVYLRKRMDSQGFVNLHFVAAFKRIRELTSDMGIVRGACESSTEIDFVVGEDDVERLRRRSGWQSFVLPMEDRDEFARTEGPSHFTVKNRGYGLGPQLGGLSAGPFGAPAVLGSTASVEAQFQHFIDNCGLNGSTNGNVPTHGGPSQLSAEVPDFSPSGPVMANGPYSLNQGTLGLPNGAFHESGTIPGAVSVPTTVNGEFSDSMASPNVDGLSAAVDNASATLS